MGYRGDLEEHNDGEILQDLWLNPVKTHDKVRIISMTA